jgi:excisionase family DNA binding protein
MIRTDSIGKEYHLNTDNAPVDRLLKVREAARYLGFSPGHLRELASAGTVPSEKLPTGGLRFRLSALDAWIAGQPTEAGAA